MLQYDAEPETIVCMPDPSCAWHLLPSLHIKKLQVA